MGVLCRACAYYYRQCFVSSMFVCVFVVQLLKSKRSADQTSAKQSAAVLTAAALNEGTRPQHTGPSLKRSIECSDENSMVGCVA